MWWRNKRESHLTKKFSSSFNFHCIALHRIARISSSAWLRQKISFSSFFTWLSHHLLKNHLFRVFKISLNLSTITSISRVTLWSSLASSASKKESSERSFCAAIEMKNLLILWVDNVVIQTLDWYSVHSVL